MTYTFIQDSYKLLLILDTSRFEVTSQKPL